MTHRSQAGASLTQFLILISAVALVLAGGIAALIGGTASLWPTLAGGLVVALTLVAGIQMRVIARCQKVNEYLTLVADPKRAPNNALTDDYDDEISQLNRQLNDFVENLRGVLVEARHASAQMRTLSHTINQATNEAHAEIDQESRDIEQMTHMIEQVSSASRSLSEQGQAISSAADNTRSLLDSGVHAYSASRASVQNLGDNIQAIANDIEHLKQRSAQIGSVLDVIGGIAEQTNLLALNAAIEAARAGEQGRGFAVVADEVRALAHRTQESTIEIQQTVSDLQSSASHAVSAISECLSLSHTSLEQSMSMESVIQQARDATAHVNKLTHEVARATQAQQDATQSINQKMLHINQVSHQLSQQLSGNANLAKSLDKEANQVDSSLNRICV
ncbi:methyl-accepting chemotaxis protein [Simiduia agarivorans]|uniref:Chemotaxis sensory transducer n=1 Tax=Simiduia agarivorans (strain DSM 21679 / JCM 13881 / BCRC 17597 / SA1) TaxID=1117647 RepID=K4KPA7_SIMAS|nr:methyl-accepting chemotaxis protein [Simiduia agarivorans]AFV00071.1 chemotaxis sensory transducer [Simiduia agarivorans SA1 = DSM 21679]